MCLLLVTLHKSWFWRSIHIIWYQDIGMKTVIWTNPCWCCKIMFKTYLHVIMEHLKWQRPMIPKSQGHFFDCTISITPMFLDSLYKIIDTTDIFSPMFFCFHFLDCEFVTYSLYFFIFTMFSICFSRMFKFMFSQSVITLIFSVEWEPWLLVRFIQ